MRQSQQRHIPVQFLPDFLFTTLSSEIDKRHGNALSLQLIGQVDGKDLSSSLHHGISTNQHIGLSVRHAFFYLVQRISLLDFFHSDTLLFKAMLNQIFLYHLENCRIDCIVPGHETGNLQRFRIIVQRLLNLQRRASRMNSVIIVHPIGIAYGSAFNQPQVEQPVAAQGHLLPLGYNVSRNGTYVPEDGTADVGHHILDSKSLAYELVGRHDERRIPGNRQIGQILFLRPDLLSFLHEYASCKRQHDRLMAQALKHCFQKIPVAIVVALGNPDKLSPRQFQSFVPLMEHFARILLIGNQASIFGILPRILFQHLYTSVGRTVVQQNHFEVSVRLIINGVQPFFQIAGMIVVGHDDADQRRLFPGHRYIQCTKVIIPDIRGHSF